VVVDGRDITSLRGDALYEVRKLFEVLFQDGALFGSMSLFDNVAFPLREHTRKSESEVAAIAHEKMEPSVDQNRVIATMQRVEGRWLVARLSAY
jgi:phospholipid/cholesterol/gamma-HCH transport system ATP-binding protein